MSSQFYEDLMQALSHLHCDDHDLAECADEIQLLVKKLVGEMETMDQKLPTQWEKGVGERKKMWVNARNHLRRQILSKI